jgi:hypothetical protein
MEAGGGAVATPPKTGRLADRPPQAAARRAPTWSSTPRWRPVAARWQRPKQGGLELAPPFQPTSHEPFTDRYQHAATLPTPTSPTPTQTVTAAVSNAIHLYTNNTHNNHSNDTLMLCIIQSYQENYHKNFYIQLPLKPIQLYSVVMHTKYGTIWCSGKGITFW